MTPLKKISLVNPIPKKLESKYEKNVLGVEETLWVGERRDYSGNYYHGCTLSWLGPIPSVFHAPDFLLI